MSFTSGPNDDSSRERFVKHSDPIAINTSGRRTRAVSVSSSSGSPSSDSASEAQTPSPSSVNSNRFPFPPTSNSPILNYFLSQSPTKTAATGTFPFSRKFGPPPVFEEPEDLEIPVAKHARRASTTMAGRFSQSPTTSNIPEPQLERGSGLLRRLSLSSGAFGKLQTDPLSNASSLPPSTPPNSAVSPTPKSQPFSHNTKSRHIRSATINEGLKPRRAPSPMGERILKGHFDGFN